ncbi:hypothetical protein [Roseibacillus persicicus]|uniref:hypothetical protein n=1 Tax=Roseibacillus persicicus TaxID=454148 RepID=UPI00280D3AAE|nr:hypothetical protein [Roseibacillus persicicus]MDQ8190900.1 hypothetical protein [Roseibacillus persicicus]
MTTRDLTSQGPRIKEVASFEELVSGSFSDGINALCWRRTLAGDFAELVANLQPQEGILPLDESLLKELPLGVGGKRAVAEILEDYHRLQALEREPLINLIDGYPRDERPGPVATDVFSYHADSAPVEADTWLCTYHGAPSEGLRNEEAVRKVEILGIRQALREEYGGPDDDEFEDYLQDFCFDLHYDPLPEARPYSFGVGNLWRIAIDWPGSLVPPCIHRAPLTEPGDPVRLLLIG